jgi:hypothetical protein
MNAEEIGPPGEQLACAAVPLVERAMAGDQGDDALGGFTASSDLEMKKSCRGSFCPQ